MYWGVDQKYQGNIMFSNINQCHWKVLLIIRQFFNWGPGSILGLMGLDSPVHESHPQWGITPQCMHHLGVNQKDVRQEVTPWCLYLLGVTAPWCKWHWGGESFRQPQLSTLQCMCHQFWTWIINIPEIF